MICNKILELSPKIIRITLSQRHEYWSGNLWKIIKFKDLLYGKERPIMDSMSYIDSTFICEEVLPLDDLNQILSIKNKLQLKEFITLEIKKNKIQIEELSKLIANSEQLLDILDK